MKLSALMSILLIVIIAMATSLSTPLNPARKDKVQFATASNARTLPPRKDLDLDKIGDLKNAG